MTTRILPPSDVFASCPLDGNILDHYAGTFEAVYVSLNPFIKPFGMAKEVFKPGTYPSRANIAAKCEPVPWSEISKRTGLPSIAAVDIGLRTQIGGLRKDLQNKNYLAAIEALFEIEGIVPPTEGNFPELLHDNVLGSIQALGYEWLWIGDEFDTERKLRWIEDIKNQEDGLSHGRFNVFTPDKQLLWTSPTGTAISHSSVLPVRG